MIFLSCNNFIKNNIEFKVFEFQEVDSFDIVLQSPILFPNHQYGLFKVTPDGCISYYTDDNYIVKNCDGKITQLKVFEYEQTQQLSNYTWIDAHRILFNFESIHFAGIQDLAVFIYHIDSHKITQKFNFSNPDFFSTKTDGFDSILNSGSSIFYRHTGSPYFEPIYFEEDSSVILPIQIISYESTTSTENLKSRNSTPILVQVFSDLTNKPPSFLPITFSEILDKEMTYKYTNVFDNTIIGTSAKNESEFLLSLPISNQIIKYNLKTSEIKKFNTSYILDSKYSGYDSYSDIPFMQNINYDFGGNIFFNKKTNIFFREITIVKSSINESVLLKNKTTLLMMDKHLEPIGFAVFQNNPGILINIDNDGKLWFLKYATDERNVIRITKINTENFNVNNLSHKLKKPKLQDEIVNRDIETIDINSYLKELLPDYKNYEQITIIPYDFACGACIDDFKKQLMNDKFCRSKIAYILIFFDNASLKSFEKSDYYKKNTRCLFIDLNNKHSDHFEIHFEFKTFINSNGYFTLFEPK
jgi:hypothetical protein